MTGNEILGLIMLLGMISIIFIGLPISFTLLFLALVFGAVGLGINQTFYLAYLQIWGSMKDDILPAVPLFIFMGYMTEQAGLMTRLFRVFRNILAPLPGSVYITVTLTAAIFAMATGIIGASVTLLGIMAGPLMIEAGYDERLSAGSIAAGGSLGILIPPSVMLIVMAPVLGVPVTYLYASAFAPGFLLATLIMFYCIGRSFLNPKLGPPISRERRINGSHGLGYEFLVAVVPMGILIGVTLGTIIAGLATATEAASCGAFGATLLALAYRKLTLETLKKSAISTLITTSMVMLLVVASNIFGAVFTNLGTPNLIMSVVKHLPFWDMGKLLIIMLIIFALGWPFEWPVVVLVFVPIFLPVVESLNTGLSKQETLLWFGILVALNLQTAFLSPPVAMSAYYLRSVVPQWKLGMIYRGMFQFMVIQIVCILLVMFWPKIALWLPRLLE